MVDLRNPTRSDGYNLLTLINRYMDMARKTGNLAARAKAEKYAKILAKTVVSPNGDIDYGQNAYFYDVADENGGRLPSRVVFYCDELGTMPAFDILPLFSAGRSRGLTMVPIIQALAQLEKNYGKEGAEILTDNCQDTIFGGFAPNSQTAEQLSKSLGSRTVLSGSVSKGKNDPSQSLQMIERPLMTPDELKSIPKGSFVVMKTGTHPMQTKLRLFLDWGITFGEPYATPEHAARPVAYASRAALLDSIDRTYPKTQLVLAPATGKHEMRRQRSGQTYEEGTP